MKVWDEVERAYRAGSTVRGRVIDRIKGGLAVDIGVKAFLPGSLVDIKPVKNLEALRGQGLSSRSSRSTRSAATSSSRARPSSRSSSERAEAETLQLLEEGRSCAAMVKNITDYGAFVDLGGMDGLLHITDMSWGRVNHPSDIVQGRRRDRRGGPQVRPRDRARLPRHKQLTEDPGRTCRSSTRRASRVTGRVTNVTDYGAFVELDRLHPARSPGTATAR